MNEKYWKKFYKEFHKFPPSSFAKFCKPYIKGGIVELGCGNGRDVFYLGALGIDKNDGNDVKDWIHKHKSPDNVYTRFFWHAIERDLQLKILKWCKGMIFIEARTTQDKPKNLFGKHKRNLVDVGQLIEDLLDNGFTILRFKQGYGMSKFKGEDPHIVRVIATKQWKR